MGFCLAAAGRRQPGAGWHKKMKILFLAPQPFFRVRGTPINIRSLVTALGEAGHEVDLVCYPYGEDVHIPGVRIHRVRRLPWVKDVKVGPSLAKIPLDLLIFFKAWNLLSRNRYDVIHAVEESAFMALWLKRRFRCHFIYDMDSHISDQLRYTGFLSSGPVLALVRRMEKSACRGADLVITVCPSLTETVTRIAPEARVVQIEDAPLQASFHEDGEGAKRLRSQLGIGNRPAVVYTGNLESYQGVALLVRAARKVVEKIPEVCFVIVGGEPYQVSSLVQLTKQLQLEDNVIFTGKRPLEEMPAFMTLATLLVSPRVSGENTALKLYTYMQSGRPIVATRLPTHTQVLDDTCAVLVAPDPSMLAEGILQVLRDPLHARTLAREATARVAARYSLASFKYKVRQAYRLLESSR